jgi:hypothetical protein
MESGKCNKEIGNRKKVDKNDKCEDLVKKSADMQAEKKAKLAEADELDKARKAKLN